MEPTNVSDLSPSLMFYEPAEGGAQSAVDRAVEAGAKRLAVVSGDAEASAEDGVCIERFDGSSIKALSTAAPDCDAVVLCEHGDPDALSDQLLACLDMRQGMVWAPLTVDHITRRSVYLISIPKSGTHMAMRLLRAFGLERVTSAVVPPGQWGTLEGGYHTPCREYMLREWSANPLGSHQLFRSVALFTYRNPLDVLASELAWYQRNENTFSHCLGANSDLVDPLLRLINDATIFGTIRDRINRYVGWMDFSNVIPVSYEELVGSTGGGSDDERLRTIWSLQLKLHIPGTPAEMAAAIYDPSSPTFHKGKIGSYKEVFNKKHYNAFNRLDQDFMEQMGFTVDEGLLGRRVEEFRRRGLRFWRPQGQEVWAPKLVRESFCGHNIVAANGQYYAISQELGSFDLDNPEHREEFGIGQGWATLDEAIQAVFQTQIGPMRIQLNQLLGFRRKIMANPLLRFVLRLSRHSGNRTGEK